jgi:hypothetical protein
MVTPLQNGVDVLSLSQRLLLRAGARFVRRLRCILGQASIVRVCGFCSRDSIFSNSVNAPGTDGWISVSRAVHLDYEIGEALRIASA